MLYEVITGRSPARSAARPAAAGGIATGDPRPAGAALTRRQSAAAGLSPMTPAMARLPMQPHVLHRELDCSSCHGAHDYDTRYAAVEACLQCHADDHSLAYMNTTHFTLWQNEMSGAAPAGTGVSCATCHMPRLENEEGRIFVP